MDSQATQPETFPAVRRMAAVAIAFVLLAGVALLAVYLMEPADPYVQTVLASEGDRERGREIFQMNCAVCHGPEGRGQVGPSLIGVSERRSSSSLIHQVVSGKTPPMPQFQASPQEMADLLRYLEGL